MGMVPEQSSKSLMNGDVLEDSKEGHQELNGYIPSPIKHVPELEEISEPST